ncbi:acyl-CoA carboxylase subunit epsilon [Streptomyces sp. NPDC059835]|uniref:acyl-CoA carboxylase subunit epsilon n=1 Tax=Streptomyces sp. NPDC059835 TaxID=3346967 RepID=UPI003662363C
MTNDAPIAPSTPSTPIAAEPSFLRIEKGSAGPEELAAIALVVACCARRTSVDAVGGAGRDRSGNAARRAGHRPGLRPARSNTGCWAGCWACR